MKPAKGAEDLMRSILVICICCLSILACQPDDETESMASPQTAETPLSQVEPRALTEEEFKRDIDLIVQNPSDYIQQKRTLKIDQMAYDYQAYYQGSKLMLLRENQNRFENGQTKRHYLLKKGRLAYFKETGELMKKPVDRLVIWNAGQLQLAQDKTQSPPRALSEAELDQIATDLELALVRLAKPSSNVAD